MKLKGDDNHVLFTLEGEWGPLGVLRVFYLCYLCGYLVALNSEKDHDRTIHGQG